MFLYPCYHAATALAYTAARINNLTTRRQLASLLLKLLCLQGNDLPSVLDRKLVWTCGIKYVETDR